MALTALAMGAILGAAAAIGVSSQLDSTTTTVLNEGQYYGVCVEVTPPDPDPCDAVDGALRYGFLGAIVNVPYFIKWRQDNPGEYSRLNAVMATPKCSVPSNPQPQTMVTMFGASLGDVAEAIACARHPQAIAWPKANPIVTGSDKQPPTPPGPITVTP